MKFLIIHNKYARAGGEEGVVQSQVDILRGAGHEVVLYERSHSETQSWRVMGILAGRVLSGFAALVNPQAVRELRALVRAERPQVAIVHNLFPVISAAILPMLKAEGVRVMMTLHNFRLVCPNGLFYTHGAICERCAQGALREWNCALRRCQGGVAESVAFAMRGFFSRMMGYYSKNVDLFLSLSDFQKSKLVAAGLPADRFMTMPNCTGGAGMAVPCRDIQRGDYVAFVGRLSPEKGVDLLFEVADMMPDVQFRVAGGVAPSVDISTRPSNVELVGFLNKQELADFYAGASCVVLTSRCWDTFPLSVIDAMYYGRAVVAPRLAALPEILDNGRCGVLYDTPFELAQGIRMLQQQPDVRTEIEGRAQIRATTLYSTETYYHNLTDAAERIL